MSLSLKELKKLRSLHTKKGRRKYNLFLGEGVRLLEEAWRFKFWPEKVYYAPSILSARGKKLLAGFARKSIAHEQITTRQLEKIADTKTPQGILALFTIPPARLTKLYSSRQRNILLCDNIADPGNLGTLLRSALAFGFDLVMLCGSSTEPYSPKVVRSSVGAVFGLKIARVEYNELESFIDREMITTIAADISGKTWRDNYDKINRAHSRVLMIGSEADGLSEKMLKLADIIIRVDHTSKVESLNAAVAGSILMMQTYDLTSNR